jgi:hypothetical protein
VLDIGSFSKVQLQLFSSKITKEIVGKLTRFRVQFVWHVFFNIYVFNNIIISHPFISRRNSNLAGACCLQGSNPNGRR